LTMSQGASRPGNLRDRPLYSPGPARPHVAALGRSSGGWHSPSRARAKPRLMRRMRSRSGTEKLAGNLRSSGVDKGECGEVHAHGTSDLFDNMQPVPLIDLMKRFIVGAQSTLLPECLDDGSYAARQGARAKRSTRKSRKARTLGMRCRPCGSTAESGGINNGCRRPSRTASATLTVNRQAVQFRHQPSPAATPPHRCRRELGSQSRWS
jgi:hypothetical protein